MTWLRLDDKFARHPKVAQLTDREFRTHIEVLCWCADYRTEGEINGGVFQAVPRLSKKTADRFVELGLWDEDERGRRVHDWKIYNAETVEERVLAYLEKHPGATANEVARNVGGKRALLLATYHDATGTQVVPERYPNGSSLTGARGVGALADPDPEENASSAAADQREVLLTEVHYDEHEHFLTSAAAPEARATYNEIEAICESLRGHDAGTINVVEPLAMLIPAEKFEKTYRKLKRKKNVGDESALFVDLLKVEVREQARAKAHAVLNAPRPETPEPASKRARTDPRSYLAEKLPELATTDEPAFVDWLDRFLTTFVEPDQHDALRTFALDARHGRRIA